MLVALVFVEVVVAATEGVKFFKKVVAPFLDYAFNLFDQVFSYSFIGVVIIAVISKTRN